MQAIIALGSNLDDPEENLREAVRYLLDFSVAPLKTSSIWRTEPVGFKKIVPEFCNAVVIIDTDFDANILLENLQEIERKMGRSIQVGERYSSRTIDLDIIDFGGQSLVSETLTLPHPRAHFRPFVLWPLLEVAPEYHFLNRSESLKELIEKAPTQIVRRSSRLIL